MDTIPKGRTMIDTNGGDYGVRYPHVPDDLIKHLEVIFPDVSVDPRDVDAAVKHGAVLVLRHLKHIQKMNEETHYVPT